MLSTLGFEGPINCSLGEKLKHRAIMSEICSSPSNLKDCVDKKNHRLRCHLCDEKDVIKNLTIFRFPAYNIPELTVSDFLSMNEDRLCFVNDLLRNIKESDRHKVYLKAEEQRIYTELPKEVKNKLDCIKPCRRPPSKKVNPLVCSIL